MNVTVTKKGAIIAYDNFFQGGVLSKVCYTVGSVT